MDPSAASAQSAADAANQRMVDRLIAEGALWSPAVIRAFRQTPRHRFLDQVFLYQRKRGEWRSLQTANLGPTELRVAYADRALVTRLSPAEPDRFPMPVSSSSQPSLMAEMLQDLRVEPGQSVLEVGTGTGYNATLLAHLAGPTGRVTSIEVDPETAVEARAHLKHFPERSIQLEQGDGRRGLPAGAPYDRIIVTASTPDLEPSWLEQLADGGIILAPVVLSPGLAYLIRATKRGDTILGRLTRPAYFMPLRAESDSTGADSEFPEIGMGEPRPAPWAEWFGKPRPRVGWLALCHSLAFFTWLHGGALQYQTDDEGVPWFGVQSADGNAGCWFGATEWRVVSGSNGAELGARWWRAFLDAGGPRPTEYRIRVRPSSSPMAGEREHAMPYGAWCWSLPARRDRPPVY